MVIEAAHFDAMTLARTSRRHKLSTEASRRFERGVDPVAAYAAAHRVAELLVELAGGTLLAEETVCGSVLPQPTTTMAATLPSTVLGTVVDRDTVVRLLTAVGATVTGEDELSLTAPSWRPDLTDPYDYVEEVGRLVGFDTIPPVVPAAPSGRGLSRAQRARRAVTAALATAGFVEVLSFSFASVEDLDKMAVPAGDERRRLNKIVNPLSETAPYLRTSLLPGLFAAVARNRSRGTEDLALFEAGSVFFAARPAAPCAAPTGDRTACAGRAGGDGRCAGSAAAPPRRRALRPAPQRVAGRGRTGQLDRRRGVRRDGRLDRRAGARASSGDAGALASRSLRRVRGERPNSSGTPVSCIPRCAGPSTCRPGPWLRRSTWTR